MQSEMKPENLHINVLPTEDDVIMEMCKVIQESSASAVALRGNFLIGLSGGSLIKMLAKGLPAIKADWDKWVLFFCDERIVPETSEDSTYGAYQKLLLGCTPLKKEQFLKVNCDLGVSEAAADYEQRLKDVAGDWPKFDLLLLGVGPDGHTCSLFPGHEALNSTKMVTSISDSPKPPPCRITLTLPIINNSTCCLFPVCGENKAKIVKEILRDRIKYPAALVVPQNGKVCWLLDKMAAALLV